MRNLLKLFIPFLFANFHSVYCQNRSASPFIIINSSEAKTVSGACVNEDFEEGSLTSPVPGTIAVTTSTSLNGWTAKGGTTTANATGNCNLPANLTGAVNNIQIIAPGPSGHNDSYIGPTYPIYSIFGAALNAGATSAYGYNCYGDWFARIGSTVTPIGVRRITKTMTVTSSNYVFDFAYLLVTANAGHCCCDAAGLSVLFKDCTGNLLPGVNQYSLAQQQSTTCSSMIFPNMNCFYITAEDSVGSDTLFPAPVNPSFLYSKWRKKSVDLSVYLGTCVQIEVNAFSCPYIGHTAYMYFDAMCGNGTSTNINLINNKILYKVYPNPNSGNFDIDISKEINSGELELRNILGQTVHKQIIKQGNNSIKTENLAKGIYNYSVLSNKEVVSVGKIVIE